MPIRSHSDAQLGKIILNKGKVTLETTEGAQVFTGEKPVTNLENFPYAAKPIVLKHKSLRWFVIQWGDKYAVQLREPESPHLKEFNGIATYPISSDWRIKAKFFPMAGKKIAITDMTGRVSEHDSPGRLVFAVNGKEYSLDATGILAHLHFVFADQTNKQETYGGGRFLDAPGPHADGYTNIH